MPSSKPPSRRKPRAEPPGGSPPPPGGGSLTELALDPHWAWNHSTDELWALLKPEFWAATHNPWVVRQTAAVADTRSL